MITERQMFILNTIKEYVVENNMSPTIRELCKITNIRSTSTIHGYIKRLENQGYIYKKDNAARSIRISNKFDNDIIELKIDN